MNGALLYYQHFCQKGRDGVFQEELYAGTSKSAESYAARATFRRAKEEGMQVAVRPLARCRLLLQMPWPKCFQMLRS